MRGAALLSAVLLIIAHPLSAQKSADQTLDIYFIDTEGGQATLFVTPAGESVLVDTGNPGSRDTERILATLLAAGVERIDHLLLTHYHTDHFGGIPELARRIPILHYIDHGPSVEANPQAAAFQEAYAELYGAARHTVVKAGDKLAVAGLEWEIVSADGAVLSTPRPGAGQPNSSCGIERPQVNPADENARSTGSLISFGEFSAIDLGDLLIPQELDLMCPLNKLGTIDLYITSHHGLATSGSAALVHALQPRVAIMNNGTRKGGAPQAFQTLYDSPHLEDLWQLHWSHNAGIELNAPGLFVANLGEPAILASVISPTPGAARAPAHDGTAYLLKVSALADGSFTVTNNRNGFTKSYR